MLSTNLELFNLHWASLEQYKTDEISLGYFTDMIIKNKPELAEYKRKLVLFLQKIDYVEILDSYGLINKSTNSCWNWIGYKRKTGYGDVIVKNRTASSIKKSVGPHRLMTFLTNLDFDLDSELQTCHSCDNPLCCNPNHLWLGTIQDNMKDKFDKNRSASGINHGRAKLTDDQVLAIYNDPRTNIIIANEYNVNKSIIGDIKIGKRKLSDKTIILPKNQNKLRLESNLIKLTNENTIEILNLYNTGLYTQKSLGIKFGVHQATISLIINGKNLKRFNQ